MDRRRIALVAAVAVPLVAVAFAAFAQQRTVTRVGIVAKPHSYSGPCPATIEFIATIHVSHHPVRVEYEWERSDGARSRREVIDIHAAGEGVSTTWTIGGHPGERRVVWERLHVLAPTGISSPEAHVRIDCRQ
ncbi:MAG TPA: hypothetical protein VLY46_10870 [Usitatibacter sp.]|nr:hypothetical protein [Usitatibacter sp.]